MSKEELEKEFREIKFEDFSSMMAYRNARVRWIARNFGPYGEKDMELYDYFCNLRT